MLLTLETHPAGNSWMRNVRLPPSFGVPAAAALPLDPLDPLDPLEANLAALNALAAREEQAFSPLAAQVAPAPVGRIPLFGQDVHEVLGLERAADALFS
jgi:hypothetical protein